MNLLKDHQKTSVGEMYCANEYEEFEYDIKSNYAIY